MQDGLFLFDYELGVDWVGRKELFDFDYLVALFRLLEKVVIVH